MKTIPQLLAEELGCKEEYVNNVVSLLDEGNTIPFIARYRKEAHGAMDDTTLRTLETRLGYLRNLQTRREEVKASIDAQGKLTDELSAAIDRALTLAEVEDLYRPYKQKRRTRATVAKEKGLEPLAQAIFEQQMQMDPPEVLAKGYINPDLGVETIEDALAGASDIIAERISDDAELRKNLRTMMQKRAVCQSRAAKPDEDSVYRLYYAFDQPVAKLQSHQILALNRGEKEGFLKVSLDLDRAQLKKVPKLGPKAFEQSAGFLRVPESAKVLDHTGVHPESYKAAEELLTRCGLKLADVGTQKLQELPARVKLYGEQKLAEDCAIGVPTMLDIVKELVKPGRDPRDELPAPILRTDVLELKDLKPGMELSGTVRNVIDFGVFVDIGVHQDGLVHISQVCSKFIKHPSEVVSVGDVVKVRVLEVDEKRKRISLTMKDV